MHVFVSMFSNNMLNKILFEEMMDLISIKSLPILCYCAVISMVIQSAQYYIAEVNGNFMKVLEFA